MEEIQRMVQRMTIFYTILGASIKTEIKLPHMNDNRNNSYIYKYILYLLMIY